MTALPESHKDSLKNQKSPENTENNTFLQEFNLLTKKSKAEKILEISNGLETPLGELTQSPTVVTNNSVTNKFSMDQQLKTLLEENRYKIIKTLGAGGMGVVELIRDQFLGREVARKTIQWKKITLSDSEILKQQTLMWRLYQEASITAILEHPNIIPLYDVQKMEDSSIQFTMRKIEGETLRNFFIKKREGISGYEETKLLNIFLKVCDAVAYAHSKGIIHRDLKPENIMIGQFGEVYVIDWGIAKRLKESVTDPAYESLEYFSQKQEKELKSISYENYYKTIGSLGTLGYMAPEQQENAVNIDIQSDIYSLGKILKECYTTRSPKEEMHFLIEQNKRKTKFTYLTHEKGSEETSEKISKDIESIIEKATHNLAHRRYSNVKAIVKDIENYLGNRQVTSREYEAIEIVGKWYQRNQKDIVWCLLLILAIFTKEVINKNTAAIVVIVALFLLNLTRIKHFLRDHSI